jgi:CelD/BcsL family acetyltransferase involved in cellulose biosynthesis
MSYPGLLQVRVLDPASSGALLEDASFLEQWDQLYARCDWATCHQTSAFCRTWYSVYAAEYAPLLVLGKGPTGGLTGLMALATHQRTGELVHCGTHHAEYHVWLADAEFANAFPEAALSALAREGPGSGLLRFLFLPPGAPLEWLNPGREWHSRASLRPLPQPLMAVEPPSDSTGEAHGSAEPDSTSHEAADPVTASPARKRLKWRTEARYARKLEREAGATLELRKLCTRRQLEPYIDEIARLCDLRQGAVNNTLPFKADALKREFYLRCMDSPAIVHCTVLTAGDRLVAAHLGSRHRRYVSLGMITHAPYFSDYSPGKLLIFYLSKLLAQEGYDEFDLTPGGEYKGRFETHTGECHALEVFFFCRAAAWHRGRRRLAQLARAGVAKLGWDWEELRTRITRLRSERIREVVADGQSQPVQSTTVRVLYRRAQPDSAVPDVSEQGAFSQNAIEEILAYDPELAGNTASVPAFLRSALENLEEGWVAATLTGQGKLRYLGWSASREGEIQLPVTAESLLLGQPTLMLWEDTLLPPPPPVLFLQAVHYRLRQAQIAYGKKAPAQAACIVPAAWKEHQKLLLENGFHSEPVALPPPPPPALHKGGKKAKNQ